MDFDKIRKRLLEAQAESGLSGRQISIRSGNAHSYWYGIIKKGKEPSVTSLAAICDAMGVSLAHILYGFDITPETEKLISYLEEHPEKVQGILSILSD